nr:protein translocase subunit SecF [Sphaerochaetaceae bacterium]
MKNSFNVLKYRKIAALPSLLFMIVGLIVLILFGFNAGIDFAAGLSERIQIAPVGLYVSYEGSDDALLSSQN